MSRRPAIDQTGPLRRAMRMVGLVLILGTLGYMWTEGWSVWQSFFFTLVTITTVGYGDDGLSEAGERFTVLMMVAGIGTLTYAAGQAVNSLVRYQLDRRRQMERTIKQLKEHFIICGLGQIGWSVCEALEREDEPFVVIDADERRVEEAHEHGWIAIEGSGTNETTLVQAGVIRARALAVLTSSDTENIVVTLTARQIHPELDIISRADKAGSVSKMEHAGATRIISPTRVGGQRIADALVRPTVSAILDPLAKNATGFSLSELNIRPGCSMDGVELRTWGSSHRGVLIVAIRGEDGEVRPHPPADQKLVAGDTLIVAGPTGDIDALCSGDNSLKTAA